MSSSVIEGWIDARRRPIVSIELEGIDDPIPVMIDTGFNGDLIIFESQTWVGTFQFDRDELSKVTLADGSTEKFFRAEGVVKWFGIPQKVEVFIIPGEKPRQARAQIGTRLLRECKLKIDFRLGKVVLLQ